MDKTGGRILLFTGDGKGKTTAALGMVLRAIGHEMQSIMIQFIKSDPATGEITALQRVPSVQMIQAGLGFVPNPERPEFAAHRRAAEEGLVRAERAISSAGHDLVILDEVCLAVAKGLLPEDEVIRIVKKAGPKTCVVLTGRGATPGLIALADTVTEMRLVKHGLQAGWEAQKGAEY